MARRVLSYGTIARNGTVSQRPGLWRGLRTSWEMSLGSTGGALRDVSGRKNHGTLIDFDLSSAWSVGANNRIPGLELTFDGSDDEINFTAVSNSVWSICAWLTRVDVTALDIVVANSGHINRNMLRLAGTTNSRFYNDASSFISFGSSAAAGQVFYCFVGTGTEFITYLDGVETERDTIDTTFTRNRIGVSGAASFNYEGSMGAVRMWDRVLTPNEISDLLVDPMAMFRRRLMAFAGAGVVAADTAPYQPWAQRAPILAQ